MNKTPPLPSRREEVLMQLLVRREMYGRELRTEYEARTGQALPLGSLYVTLDRMEEKGFIASRQGESDPVRGGNRKKHFRLTAAGVRALNRAREWSGDGALPAGA